MPVKVKASARTYIVPKDYKRRKPDPSAPPSGVWYAVICNVNAEKRAQRALGGNVCPDPNDTASPAPVARTSPFMTYLPPTVKLTKAPGSRDPRNPIKAVIERPLFPRYLFVASRSPAFPFFALRGVIGVESIVRCEGVPMPIPHGVIEAIMRRDTAGEFVEAGIEKEMTLADVGLSTGESVRLLAGAFQGLNGVIQSLMPKSQAKILLNILGAAVPVTMPLADLEKAS